MGRHGRFENFLMDPALSNRIEFESNIEASRVHTITRWPLFYVLRTDVMTVIMADSLDELYNNYLWNDEDRRQHVNGTWTASLVPSEMTQQQSLKPTLHYFDLLWICYATNQQARFRTKSCTTNPKHLDMSSRLVTCDQHNKRGVTDASPRLLCWSQSRNFCTTNPQQIEVTELHLTPLRTSSFHQLKASHTTRVTV